MLTAAARFLLLVGLSTGYPRGNAGAPVQVVEFADFGCRYCAVFARDVMPAVEREFIVPGRVRWVLIPVASASTPHAMAAARAVECASQQGGTWPMHELLFARQKQWLRSRDPVPRFAAYARELGLDVRSYAACERSSRTAATVARYRQLAKQAGVRIAPTFLVNGRRVEGSLSLADTRTVLRTSLPPR